MKRISKKKNNLSCHDGVVCADGDKNHIVNLRKQERGIVDVALQNHLKT